MDYPVIDAEEEALRDLGRKTDMEEGRPTDSDGAQKPEQIAPPAKEETQEKPQPTPEKEQKPDTSEPEPEEPEQVAAKDKGRFKSEKEPVEGTNGDAPPVEEKQKSQYAKAREREAKETDRRERSWMALQKQKEEFRAQQEEWEKQRRMEQLKAEAADRPLEKGGIDMQGYQRAYQDFRARAQASNEPEDWRNSLQSLETVLELEAQGRQQQEIRQRSQYELNWRTQMEDGIKNHADLQDPDSALYQEVDRIVKQEPYLYYIPGGFSKAVEIATLLLGAGSDSELRDELEKANARIEELERGSQPARGGPGKPPKGSQAQEEMSEAEEEKYLRELSYREDSFMRR